MKTEIEVGKVYANKKGEVCKIVEYDNGVRWPFVDHKGYTYDNYGYYGEPSGNFDLVQELTPEEFPEYFI